MFASLLIRDLERKSGGNFGITTFQTNVRKKKNENSININFKNQGLSLH